MMFIELTNVDGNDCTGSYRNEFSNMENNQAEGGIQYVTYEGQ